MITPQRTSTLFLLIASVCLSRAAEHELRVKVPPGVKPGDTITVRFENVPDESTVSTIPSSHATATTNSAEPSTSTGPSSTTTSSSDELGKRITGVNFDQPMSAAPAFMALDLSPETVSRPGTPREFAASLLNGVDRSGTLKSGIALETSPVALFFGERIDLATYNARGAAGFWTRAAYNTSLSIGTAKASGDSKEQHLSVGLAVTLFDKGDVRQNPDFVQAAQDVHAAHRIGPPDPFATAEDNKKWEAEQNKAAAAIETEFTNKLQDIRRKAWGSSAAQLACAPVWITETGNVGDLKYDGFSAWGNYAYGFEGSRLHGHTQLIALARYRQGEHVMDPNDKTAKADRDTFLVAARLRYGSPDFNGSAEAGYIRAWHGLEGDQDIFRVGAVVEKRIGENLWLVFSVGDDFGGGKRGGDNLFAISSFRVGSSDKPQLKLQ